MLLSETESAASLLEQALAIKARTIGTRHLSYATSIHNLAVAKQQSRDLVRAEALYREEIDILRAAGEENSEDCAHWPFMPWPKSHRSREA